MRPTLAFLTVAAMALLAAGPTATKDNDDACTYKDPKTERYYSLQALRRTTGEDWTAEAYGTGYKFHLNVCHELVGDKSHLKNAEEAAIMAQRDDEYFSLGQTSDHLIFRGDRLLLKYTNGDRCEGSSAFDRSSLIAFVCDKSVEGLGKPEFVGEANKCAYFFEWRTPAACSTSEPSESTFAGTFFVVSFVLQTLYMFFGILYNRFTKQARGLEQIPHYHTWKKVFDYVKDMSMIIFATIIGKIRNRRSANNARYQHVGESDANTLIDDDFI
ncbi:Cation-independent mannose-6-phosphate receptor CI-MPR [Tieghemiomyces parasiticus]|uniref:Cation-independent mannose-6-phosphate receptor CI-MPR n=1 Tax=Tieghemiomyces parasiticus TaxID=78921 RepID=A0A9W8AK01_9FUNG|nr:Cation-independent mannose-6-phosphate receptor CI-MPR [Tieghemiomyces parasiticus]